MAEESGSDPHGRITLVPDGVTLDGSEKSTILEVLQESGLRIGSSCGGQGTCGECRVRFVAAAPEPEPSDLNVLEPEAIAAGWRLACAHSARGTLTIELPPRSGDLDQKAADATWASKGELHPAVTSRIADLKDRSQDDWRPLSERLDSARHPARPVPLHVLRRMARARQDGDGSVRPGCCQRNERKI